MLRVLLLAVLASAVGALELRSTEYSAENDEFGSSVALIGTEVLLVGAERTSIGVGEALVFTRNGTRWDEQLRLCPPVEDTLTTFFGQNFGSSVAGAAVGRGDAQGRRQQLLSVRVFVGAPNMECLSAGDKFTANDHSCGAAYVFTIELEEDISGLGWNVTNSTRHQTLRALDVAPNARFGHMVDCSSDGRVLLVASMQQCDARHLNGAIYIFHVGDHGGEWRQQARLSSQDCPTTSNDRFGESAVLSGDGLVAVVGAYYAPPGHEGAVYVFSRPDSAFITPWVLERLLQPPATANPNSNFGFGIAVNYNASTIATCTPADQHVFFFNRAGGLEDEVVAPDPTAGRYGCGVKLTTRSSDGTDIALVSTLDTQYNVYGEVYAWRRVAASPLPELSNWHAMAKRETGEERDAFGGTLELSADGDVVIVGAPGAPSYYKRGKVFVMDLNVTEVCPAGSSRNLPTLACAPCGVGHFSPTVERTACLQCDPGRYASERGSVECTDCASGSYAPSSGMGACLGCEVGGFCPNASVLPLSCANAPDAWCPANSSEPVPCSGAPASDPPSSGWFGPDCSTDLYQVTEGSLDVGPGPNAVIDPDSGRMLTFEAWTRDRIFTEIAVWLVDELDSFSLPCASPRFSPPYVSCYAPAHGAGYGLRVHVVREGADESRRVLQDVPLLSYPEPRITRNTLSYPGTSIAPPLFLESTGEPVKLQFDGSDFTTRYDLLRVTARSRYGGRDYDCVVDVTSSSPNSITCTMPAGATGRELYFTVRQGNHQVEGVDSFSYPILPIVWRASGCAEQRGNATAACPTAGGVEILVEGASFDSQTTVSIGAAPCERVDDRRNSTRLVCLLPPGTGANLLIQVHLLSATTRPISSESSAFLLSYRLPAITRLWSDNCTSREALAVADCPREGGSSLTLTGSAFGTRAGSARVLVGGAFCLGVEHVNDTFIACQLPPGKRTQRSVHVIQENSGEINANGAASLSFLQCAAGTVEEADDNAFGCTNCSAGFFNSRSGQTRCQACEPGKYSPHAGAAGCRPCEAGKFSARFNQTACEPCDAGSVSQFSSAGTTFCVPCPLGSFAESRTLCSECAPGFFSSRPGAAFCRRCEFPTFALHNGSDVCSECDSGRQYARFRHGAFIRCEDCPTGVNCATGGNVTARRGYWIDTHPETGRVTAYECLTGEYCAQGGRCAANRVTAERNPLCGACVEGKREWGNECVNCAETRLDLIFVLFACSLLFVAAFHSLSQKTSGELRITAYFIQVVFLFVGPENGVVLFVLSVFNANFIDSTGSTCIADFSVRTRLYLRFLGPMLTYGTWIVFVAVSVLLQRIRATRCSRGSNDAMPYSSSTESSLAAASFSSMDISSKADRSEVGHSSATQGGGSMKPHLRTLVALWLFQFNGVVTGLVEFFDCRDVQWQGETIEVMHTFPRVQCSGPDDEDWQSVRPAAVVLIILQLGVIPLALFAMVTVFRRSLFGTRYMHVFGVLTDTFRPALFWWQLVVLFRRVTLICAAVFLKSGTSDNTDFAVLSLLNLLFLLMHMLVRPWKQRADNIADGLSLTLLTLITIALPLLKEPYSDTEQWIIMFGTVVPVCAFLLWTASEKFRRFMATKSGPGTEPSDSSEVEMHRPL